MQVSNSKIIQNGYISININQKFVKREKLKIKPTWNIVRNESNIQSKRNKSDLLNGDPTRSFCRKYKVNCCITSLAE